MATWSTLETLGTIGAVALASDGSHNIYYVQSGVIKEYDVDTDTVTSISDGSSFPDFPSPALTDNSAHILVWFNGGLYCVVDDEGENPFLLVYKWDGSGTSWTLVLTPTFSLEPTSGTNSNWFLDKSDSHLIFARCRFVTSPSYNFEVKIYYSSNGTSWSVGNFDNTTTPPSQYSTLNFDPKGQGNPNLGAYAYFWGRFGADPSSYQIAKVMKWNEATVTYDELFAYKNEAGTPSGDAWVYDDYDTTLNAHWNSTPEYEIDPLSGSFSAPSDTDIQLWDHELGFLEARTGILHDTDSGTLYFHLMTSAGTVDAGEVMTTSRTAKRIIRMPSDGDVYAILASGSSSEVWGRSDPLDVPAGDPDELRYLRMVSDSGSLYVTGSEDESGALYVINLESLTKTDTHLDFGTVAYSDLDTRARLLLPVVKPTADGVVYVYGRDGNNIQVQYSDLSGTAGWVNIGPGTATWGTADVAIALMLDPLNPTDALACFADDDVFRTQTGTSDWVQIGDATTGMRAAAMFPTRAGQFLAAGTAGGTSFYSHNYGTSFFDTGDTIIGTINWVEPVVMDG